MNIFVADCPFLRPGEGALASSRETAFGTAVTFTCPVGQEFATGKNRIYTECMPGGNWSISYIPKCQGNELHQSQYHVLLSLFSLVPFFVFVEILPCIRKSSRNVFQRCIVDQYRRLTTDSLSAPQMSPTEEKPCTRAMPDSLFRLVSQWRLFPVWLTVFGKSCPCVWPRNANLYLKRLTPTPPS